MQKRTLGADRVVAAGLEGAWLAPRQKFVSNLHALRAPVRALRSASQRALEAHFHCSLSDRGERSLFVRFAKTEWPCFRFQKALVDSFSQRRTLFVCLTTRFRSGRKELDLLGKQWQVRMIFFAKMREMLCKGRQDALLSLSPALAELDSIER